MFMSHASYLINAAMLTAVDGGSMSIIPNLTESIVVVTEQGKNNIEY